MFPQARKHLTLLALSPYRLVLLKSISPVKGEMVLRGTRGIRATLVRGPAAGLPVEAEAAVGDH